MVEQKPSKLKMRVRFPSPAPVLAVRIQARSQCPCSSVVEHSLGKGEVTCSIHVKGTIIFYAAATGKIGVFQFSVYSLGV